MLVSIPCWSLLNGSDLFDWGFCENIREKGKTKSVVKSESDSRDHNT